MKLCLIFGFKIKFLLVHSLIQNGDSIAVCCVSMQSQILFAPIFMLEPTVYPLEGGLSWILYNVSVYLQFQVNSLCNM